MNFIIGITEPKFTVMPNSGNRSTGQDQNRDKKERTGDTGRTSSKGRKESSGGKTDTNNKGNQKGTGRQDEKERG
jgi:hypothetical protein